MLVLLMLVEECFLLLSCRFHLSYKPLFISYSFIVPAESYHSFYPFYKFILFSHSFTLFFLFPLLFLSSLLQSFRSLIKNDKCPIEYSCMYSLSLPRFAAVSLSVCLTDYLSGQLTVRLTVHLTDSSTVRRIFFLSLRLFFYFSISLYL